MKKGLWEIAEEINEELPGDKNKRFILYGTDYPTNDELAYIFERKFDEREMTLADKMYKFFFKKKFHETKNKLLIRLDNFMNMNYLTIRYIQPMQKELEEISKEFSKKYELQYKPAPKNY